MARTSASSTAPTAPRARGKSSRGGRSLWSTPATCDPLRPHKNASSEARKAPDVKYQRFGASEWLIRHQMTSAANWMCFWSRCHSSRRLLACFGEEQACRVKRELQTTTAATATYRWTQELPAFDQALSGHQDSWSWRSQKRQSQRQIHRGRLASSTVAFAEAPARLDPVPFRTSALELPIEFIGPRFLSPPKAEQQNTSENEFEVSSFQSQHGLTAIMGTKFVGRVHKAGRRARRLRGSHWWRENAARLQ